MLPIIISIEPRFVCTSCGSPDDILCPFLGQVNHGNLMFKEVTRIAIICLACAFGAIGILNLSIVASLLNESVTITISFLIQFGFTLKMTFILRTLRRYFLNKNCNKRLRRKRWTPCLEPSLRNTLKLLFGAYHIVKY